MSAPWPPPLDLASLEQLVREADVEGLIAREGAPADEYEPEEKALFERLRGFATEQLNTPALLPILEEIWNANFDAGDEAVSKRRPHLLSLAKEIERFFGPESKPRTRRQILED